MLVRKQGAWYSNTTDKKAWQVLWRGGLKTSNHLYNRKPNTIKANELMLSN